jgi:hypothetical protein
MQIAYAAIPQVEREAISLHTCAGVFFFIEPSPVQVCGLTA